MSGTQRLPAARDLDERGEYHQRCVRGGRVWGAMSEDNDQRAKPATTDAKTIIGTGKPTEGSGAHRRPGEYIVTRKEVSGAHKVPMPEGTGVGKANDKTTAQG